MTSAAAIDGIQRHGLKWRFSWHIKRYIISMNPLAQLLQQARHSLNLTQQQLGDRLGVTRQTIAKWERGDIPEGSILTVCLFVGEVLAQHEKDSRSWQAKHDVLDYKMGTMRVQILTIVG